MNEERNALPTMIYADGYSYTELVIDHNDVPPPPLTWPQAAQRSGLPTPTASTGTPEAERALRLGARAQPVLFDT